MKVSDLCGWRDREVSRALVGYGIASQPDQIEVVDSPADRRICALFSDIRNTLGCDDPPDDDDYDLSAGLDYYDDDEACPECDDVGCPDCDPDNYEGRDDDDVDD